MAILSITISAKDKKLFYIKKSIEEGESKFSCHHFTFDADNHAEFTLDENGVIKNIAPCKHATATEQMNLSSSRSGNANSEESDLKFIKNSTASIVIIDSESFLKREHQSRSLNSESNESEEKVILSIEKLDDDLDSLKLHVERIMATLESA